jgi:AraC-like DNA-binding protein
MMSAGWDELMARTLPVGETGRLERSCGRARPDSVRSRDLRDGVHALQAWFGGRGYEPHRHDVYTIGLTDVGLQAFDYRGAARLSRPGQVVVLHPDEVHDGRAATRDGFGYRAIYLAPARIAEAARALRRHAGALPFVREPVIASARLARTIEAAFADDPEPLAVDDLVVRVTAALLDADPSYGSAPTLHVDGRAVARARQFLETETTRVVRSAELAAVSGLSRYELARQFRAALGTSPYRYSLMRRLDRARELLRRRQPPAEVALAAGFADQAHLTRMFKAALGLTPARYRGLAV